uniref:Uncharacterized protein n=1 Tax=Panagrellus redivivus TaxID=6233 RepID=A0A7E4USD1_PANRE
MDPLQSNDYDVTEKHLTMVNYKNLLADQLRARGSSTKAPRLWATIYAYTKDKDAENNKLDAEPLNDDEWHAATFYHRNDIGCTLRKVGDFLQNDNSS